MATMVGRRGELKGGLELLERAERLGNVSKACREVGCSRSQYYKLRLRYQQSGADGLRARERRNATNHPAATSKEVAERILRLSHEHPAWGCERISRCLAEGDIRVSPPTVHKILKREGLSTAEGRWLRLERLINEDGFEASLEQQGWLVRMNPSWKEPEALRLSPGERIVVDTIRIGHRAGLGVVNAVAAVDVRTNYAFAVPCTANIRNHAVLLLNNAVVPHLEQTGSPTRCVETDASREFAGDRTHPLESFLRIAGIEHDVRSAGEQLTGAMLRFRRAMRCEFASGAFLCETLNGNGWARIRSDLSRWVRSHNEVRLSLGFPNYGVPPAQVLTRF